MAQLQSSVCSWPEVGVHIREFWQLLSSAADEHSRRPETYKHQYMICHLSVYGRS